MTSPSLRIPLHAGALWLAALRRPLQAVRRVARELRARRRQARALRRAHDELAAMSLHGLRDIGAPEALLQRRQRDDARQRAWQHLSG